MDKKGFLFTVTIFLVLVYILLSISVWVKSIEASERSFSEFYKESTVELTIEQITPLKMDNVVRTIMLRNLMRLDDHALEYAVEQGPAGDENANIRAAMSELLQTGAADGSHFRGGVGLQPEANSSLAGWASSLNASLQSIGVYVSDFEVTNFQMGQSDIDRVNYSVDIKLGLRDYANTSSVSRNYHLSNSVGISGLVDPALARESRDLAGDDKTIYRQFFFKKDIYPGVSDISVQKLESAESGQGWLYGPLALANGSYDLVPNALTVDPGQRRLYTLVGTYDEITDLTATVYDQFAGYIITSPASNPSSCTPANPLEPLKLNEGATFNPLVHSGSSCDASFASPTTSKPFIVSPGFDVADAAECPVLNETGVTRRCVLFLNRYLENEVAAVKTRKLSSHPDGGIYNLEGFRDYIMCGYYTHNPAAPSYMQRLLNDSYSRSSPDYGIETFVIGVYANDTAYDMNGRLDREFFNSAIDGIKIRGFPGCKNYAMCSDSPISGIFAVSEDTKNAYGLGQIACDNGAAGCD
ncbi:MAG: hypothetical protein AB1295_03125 [Candidatus Micrarchaeota archaeon]